jgi:hypothetical protein
LVSAAERGEVILHSEAPMDNFAFKEREAIGSGGSFAETYRCVPKELWEAVVALKTYKETNRLLLRELALLR